MSNMLYKGKRDLIKKNRKELKLRKKEFYKILDELEEIALRMVLGDVIITEENIVEEASKYTEREIGDYERFILLGKTQQFYETKRYSESKKR